ncbi:MAG: TorF family putative porin [Rubrivivax sp.]
MKKTLLGAAAAVALTALPTLSHADLAFNAGVFTDYRFRGISQTRLKPAVQGGADYDINGFYVGAWASNIKWIKDAGGNANVEIDIYGGYKGKVNEDLGYDVGVLTYQYPSNRLNPSANTTEVYGAVSFGPATLKYSHSVTDLFGFVDSKNSGYLDLSAGFEVGPVTLTPHVGYQKVRHNGNASYTDFALTVSKDFDGIVLSASLVGTDTKRVNGVPAYVSPAGKNLGKGGLVLGLKTNF